MTGILANTRKRTGEKKQSKFLSQKERGVTSRGGEIPLRTREKGEEKDDEKGSYYPTGPARRGRLQSANNLVSKKRTSSREA